MARGLLAGLVFGVLAAVLLLAAAALQLDRLRGPGVPVMSAPRVIAMALEPAGVQRLPEARGPAPEPVTPPSKPPGDLAPSPPAGAVPWVRPLDAAGLPGPVPPRGPLTGAEPPPPSAPRIAAGPEPAVFTQPRPGGLAEPLPPPDAPRPGAGPAPDLDHGTAPAMPALPGAPLPHPEPLAAAGSPPAPFQSAATGEPPVALTTPGGQAAKVPPPPAAAAPSGPAALPEPQPLPAQASPLPAGPLVALVLTGAKGADLPPWALSLAVPPDALGRDGAEAKAEILATVPAGADRALLSRMAQALGGMARPGPLLIQGRLADGEAETGLLGLARVARLDLVTAGDDPVLAEAAPGFGVGVIPAYPGTGTNIGARLDRAAIHAERDGAVILILPGDAQTVETVTRWLADDGRGLTPVTASQAIRRLAAR